MGKTIRDLTPISAHEGCLEEDDLFECLTRHLDEAGIYARKVRSDEIEGFILRAGGGTKEYVSLKVMEERERAEQAENGELERAEGAESLLQKIKADMYVVEGPGRLMDAQVGANINRISFNMTVHPELVDSYIQCGGGTFRVENEEFFFQPAQGERVVFYTGGDWTSAAIGVFEAPGLVVDVNHNANGGVWDNHYGSHLVGLVELRDTLRAEITAEKNRAELEEDTIKTSITGKVEEGVAAHNTSAAAHQDIRAKIVPTPAQNGRYSMLVSAGSPQYAPMTIPEAPQIDGSYKLVISGGAPSWQEI